MTEIRELLPYFKENPQEAQKLTSEVKGALLDPTESVRKGLIEDVNRKLNNHLQRGFVAENQLFVIVRKENSEPIYYQVCNMPETYAGSPRKPHRFYRENNRFISM